MLLEFVRATAPSLTRKSHIREVSCKLHHYQIPEVHVCQKLPRSPSNVSFSIFILHQSLFIKSGPQKSPALDSLKTLDMETLTQHKER